MKKIKWGVIGAGGIADRRTIPGILLADNAELVAVMDRNAVLVAELGEKYGVASYCTEEDLLNDSEIEAVYIATPVFCHKNQAELCAKAGKHILLEKPLGLTVAEGKKIIDVCNQNNVKLAAGLMMRYSTYHQKMKSIIADGKLGQIVSVRAQLTCWYPDIEGAWRQNKELSGGGALMDMGIHCIDLLQFITGSEVTKVSSFNGTKSFSYSVDDSSSSLLEFDNGAFGYVDANFNIPDEAAKCRLEIYGTKGSMLAEGTVSQIDGGNLEIIISDDNMGYDAKQDRTAVDSVDVKVEFGNLYTREIESFGNSIINDNTPEVTGEQALFVQRIIEACYESQDLGKVITL